VPHRDSTIDPAPAPLSLWPYVLAFSALVALGLAFGEMARLARLDSPDSLDRHVLAWVNNHQRDWPALEYLFQAVTRLGDPEFASTATVLVAIALVWLARRRVASLRVREAVFWVGVCYSAWLLCSILKLWFQRKRPPVNWHRVLIDDTSFSFPSSHSVFAAVFFTMLATLLGRMLPRSQRWLRHGSIGICIALALLVGASRVWLSVHYLSDVAGGLVLGVAWVIIAYLIRYGWAHWRLRQRCRAE
jgi:membrane-associated phospholipid phosphatase